MPSELALPMALFRDLAGARHYAEGGVPLPIPPSEIAAWFLLRGIRPNARLLWYLRRLDAAWTAAMRRASGQSA